MEIGLHRWWRRVTTANSHDGARDLAALAHELVTAKARFGLAREAPVVSCYEAGRDGFWVHRALTSLGVTNVVVDSANIEGTRRARQAKSDRLDTAALLAKLGRFHGGERGVWSVVSVPSVDDEDRHQLHRELFAPRRQTVSAWTVVEQDLPPRYRGGPAAASNQLSRVQFTPGACQYLSIVASPTPTSATSDPGATRAVS